jgi:predicted Zn-dependent protease
MARSRKLTLEALEDRTVPATFGVPWPNPAHLTLSFAPDGTMVGNQPSQLFHLLNASAPTAAWQGTILRAFQDWAATTNLNLSVVPDSGDPLGTVGPIQGDPRFGDIRITAVPLPADVVGVAIPFDVTAGSWAGDVELNSNYLFGVNGSAGAYDLLTVALHEAGHSLGIDDGTDPASPMNTTYVGTRTGLTAGDIGAVQALYGTRRPDAFDAASPNNTLATATQLNMIVGGDVPRPTVADAGIASPADADFYRFQVGETLTNLTFLVQTSGDSLLLPSLTVYGPTGAVVGSAVAATPGQGDLSLHLTGLQLRATYTAEVAAATADALGAGNYRLQVVPDGGTPAGATSPTVTVLPNDAHTNDTIGTATDLRQSAYQNMAAYAYATQTAITDATDVDYYHLRTPQTSSNATTVMRILVWGTDVGGLDPGVSVFDAHGNAVAADVLVNENGSEVLQVAAASGNADYYVSVRAERPGGVHSLGNYFLGANFSPQAVALQAFTSGTLSQSASTDYRTLQVNQSQLFHLVLSANSGAVPAATAVKMTVYDAAGTAVGSVTALNGEGQSLTLFLAPGTYTVRFSGGTRDGSPLPATAYTLRGVNLSDPIGPQPTDPTLAPAPPPQPDTTQSNLGFYWLQLGYYSGIGSNDPGGYPIF